MDRTINTKQLRETLPEIVNRVRKGERFTVLYRSAPAFRLVPVTDQERAMVPVEEDTLFEAEPVGRSSDGLTATDHDRLLYRES